MPGLSTRGPCKDGYTDCSRGQADSDGSCSTWERGVLARVLLALSVGLEWEVVS